jgi:hypothetical protein
MKKHEVSEEFLKEAYEAACDSWKEKMRKEFPDVFNHYFEFGETFKLGVYGGGRPLFIGHGVAPENFKYKCLVLHKDFELEQEIYDGETILKFKYKY